MKYTLYCIATMTLFLTGCISQPKVETTKVWEGHYLNINDFNNATSNIVLDKNESIWVLSNSTLYRLLQNTRK